MSVLDPFSHPLAAVMAAAHAGLTSLGADPASGVTWTLCIVAVVDTIGDMNDFRDLARHPEHRRKFEKLLYLAALRGDADLVAERLSWGIDPNCRAPKGTTPLIANVRSFCPSAATVRAWMSCSSRMPFPLASRRRIASS